MQREPVVMVLGTGTWKYVYEGVMVALAVLVVALLPFGNEALGSSNRWPTCTRSAGRSVSRSRRPSWP